MERRAVFLDLDGTYADARGIVPDSARRAVVEARANGHLVLLCTGRSLALLNEHVLEAGFDGLITSAGGCVEIDGQVLLHQSIPIDDLAAIVTYLQGRGVEFYLEGNSGLYASPASRDRVREAVFGGVTDDSVRAQLQKGVGWIIDMCIVDQDLVRPDINTVNILASDNPVQTYRAEFGSHLDVRPGSVRMLGPNNAEVTLAGRTKAGAIELTCAHLGVPWEATIGFGDGANDLEMIRYVHTGVAMGNAEPEVKQAATFVTGAPEEDGIRTSFRELGLI